MINHIHLYNPDPDILRALAKTKIRVILGFDDYPLFVLLLAIESLYSALVASNLHTQIKISMPNAASIILDPFPPSQAFVNQSLIPIILPLIQFLSRTRSPLMFNLYPCYVFMQNKGLIPLDNSLFKPLTPSNEMVGPNTLLHYMNILDAMIDSAYFAMKNLNITDVLVLVTDSR
ncbi:hypothetical protein HHK36_010618 [Tetracentron sinense]|uniref:Glucan endo-1,3-beta-D-glucosidase n=1 Tax=Tetracentron sinense TaxID=13715 RepID=A0A834ZCA5_TETSI|nr:hypothetical protein HHK36_010618 [Tetracentron sinense]